LVLLFYFNHTGMQATQKKDLLRQVRSFPLSIPNQFFGLLSTAFRILSDGFAEVNLVQSAFRAEHDSFE